MGRRGLRSHVRAVPWTRAAMQKGQQPILLVSWSVLALPSAFADGSREHDSGGGLPFCRYRLLCCCRWPWPPSSGAQVRLMSQRLRVDGAKKQ
mmetsp:Transcript_125126/g.359301  ORF Transcript_125126/g.359301 Transcript_125126/m.359301 type:complete len:93 (-) Transcript_125126:1320-1598(-)